jgi:hypothetical protein
MSEQAVRLRNCRQQPVELHLPYGVIVLPPGGEAVVPASLLATTPQLAWLVDRGKLSTEPLAAASASSDVDAAGAADTPDARGADGDAEPDAAPGPAGASRPKRDTTRRSGRAHKP